MNVCVKERVTRNVADSEGSSRNMDGDLIESVLAGQGDAFEELVAPHLHSLTRFASMKLRNESEAEDVVQQAVLRRIALFDSSGARLASRRG